MFTGIGDIPAIILFIVVLIICYVKKKRQVGSLSSSLGGMATVVLAEKKLQCSHCGFDRFRKREGILATTWVTLFQFTFWNESARCFVCAKCGFVHWFLNREEKIEEQPW